MKALILTFAFLYCIGAAWAATTGLVGFRVTLTAAGTAQRLSTTKILSGNILIQAEAGNTSNIILGDSSVLLATGNGLILEPGQAAGFEYLSPFLSGNFYDLNKIFFDGGTNGDAINVTRLVGN